MALNQTNSSLSSATTSSNSQEFIVRVPNTENKRYHVMKFNSSLNVDFTKWSHARLERENNLKDLRLGEDMPKFGAGSEYGRELREEARKKKYGIIMKKYNPDDQPWQLRIGDKSGKRYRGIREGGITENASYYVFTQAPDGAFEAFPIDEWYNFTPVQPYRTLNAEEAEEEFGRRDKVFNYFSIMMKKRLKNEDEEDGGGNDKDATKKKDKKPYKAAGGFKISDMDDWVNSSDEEDEDEEEEGNSQNKNNDKKPNKSKQQAAKKKKKKKKNDSDDEAWEDSDDGDDEGREVDYISDESSSSGDEPEVKVKDELKGVEDEEAIRKMEESDSESEEGSKKEGMEETKEDASLKEKGTGKEKKAKKDASSSESSSDTSDSDDFDNDSSFQSAMFMQGSTKSQGSKKSQKKGKKEGSNSGTSTPTSSKLMGRGTLMGGVKRGCPESDSKDGPLIKKSKSDSSSHLSGAGSSTSMDGISEEAVRRYLMRKPMTTTELLQKFKSKKTGLGRDQMVNTITQILKRLDPVRQMIKGKMYLSMRQF